MADLAAHGRTVVNLDLAPPPDGPPEGSRWLRTDVTDHGQVLGALTGTDEHRSPDGSAGFDALVHLAAVPAPGVAPDHATSATNVASTHSAFTAARAAGSEDVVWASSETVLGLPFDEAPPYVPVDEEYAPRPSCSYSLSRDLGGEMARQPCRWDPGTKIIGLRSSNVMDPGDHAAFPGNDADPQSRRFNLWGYVDARDGAQAVRLAVEHRARGADVFIVANADTVVSRSSADLVAQVAPGVEVRRDLGEHETLLSIDEARRVLGHDPQHSWRTGPNV